MEYEAGSVFFCFPLLLLLIRRCLFEFPFSFFWVSFCCYGMARMASADT